jgi:hypothetical protein
MGGRSSSSSDTTMGSSAVRPRFSEAGTSSPRTIGSSTLLPRSSGRVRSRSAQHPLVVEWATPVAAKARVLAAVLVGDIVEDAVGEMVQGFFGLKVELDFMERTMRPEIWFQGRGDGVVDGGGLQQVGLVDDCGGWH